MIRHYSLVIFIITDKASSYPKSMATITVAADSVEGDADVDDLASAETLALGEAGALGEALAAIFKSVYCVRKKPKTSNST